MKRCLSVVLLLALHSAAFAQIKLARLFSDHVVLQRQKAIPVWGWASPNETVKVSLANQTQSAQADASGKWLVKFSPMEAGGPHQLTASAQSGNVSVKDILIGEVWLCSGQSNMEWRVANADNYLEEKKDADYPQIRHFFVEHEVSMVPEKELKSGEWKLASSENVGNFTAVGFFFARELYKKLNIPIGLLHSSWGGSQIEGWISKEAMLTDEDLKAYAQNLPDNWTDADAILDKKTRASLFGDDKINPSADDEKKYLSANYVFSKWKHAGSPLGQWDWKGIWMFRGSGYMARMIEVPAEIVAKETTLGLGVQDNLNEIYINGELIFKGIVKGVRKISIPADTWKAGDNKLVIKFGKMVEPSWYGLGLMGTADDLYLTDGSLKISLAENWKIMPSFADKHEYLHSSNNVGTTIYNSMIAPLVPFAIRGALWYQGESNAGRAYQYRTSFPLMINDWRKQWNDDFSFYFVQLSSFGSYQNSNQGSNWGELREAQTMTLSLPKTGMAVTTDVGNPKDIHPTNKQDVGHRLAVNALKFDYGQNVLHSGPMFESVKFDKGKATLSFKYVGKGLSAKDKFGYLKGFEIAGDDKTFYYAKAEIIGNKVVVYHPKGVKPVAVRYGWADAPEEANLFNADGLPASPFRTDDWKGLTISNKFE